jgi:hypothetical protein
MAITRRRMAENKETVETEGGVAELKGQLIGCRGSSGTDRTRLRTGKM